MSAIINGSSPSVTFSDGTTQATSAIVSGKVPYTNLPAGSVLQVVQATSTTNAQTSSTSFVTTGFSATITPKFSTSKVLILHAAPCYNNSVNYQIDITMYRGGSNIAPNTALGSIYAGLSQSLATIAFNYLDSPATTSATTYTVYFRSTYGAGNVTYNNGGFGGSIILLEIAA